MKKLERMPLTVATAALHQEFGASMTWEQAQRLASAAVANYLEQSASKQVVEGAASMREYKISAGDLEKLQHEIDRMRFEGKRLADEGYKLELQVTEEAQRRARNAASHVLAGMEHILATTKNDFVHGRVDLASCGQQLVDYVRDMRAQLERTELDTAEPDPNAPTNLADLPDFWDTRRALEGKPDKSRCAAELRRALSECTIPPSCVVSPEETRDFSTELDPGLGGRVALAAVQDALQNFLARRR